MKKDKTGPLFYQDDKIKIYRLRDDQGESLLTYWYVVQCRQCKVCSDDIDVRALSMYKDLVREKRVNKIFRFHHDRIHFINNVVPAIIAHAISNGEISIKPADG